MQKLFENWRHYLEEQRKQALNPWPEEFERLKKAFIEKEVYARQAQIKNIMRDKLIKVHPSRYDSKNIIERIARFIQATVLSIDRRNVCGSAACYIYGKKIGAFQRAPGKIHIDSTSDWFLSMKGMYTDDDGAFRNQAMNMFTNVIYHELGHAKELAIDNALKVRDLRAGGYSSLTLDRTRKCFPGLKTARGAKEHHELPYEHYASLSELRARLGRPLNRVDIELVCAHKNKKLPGRFGQYVKFLKAWEAQNVKKGAYTAVEFLNNEIWDTFSCKNCGPDGDIDFALKLMNDMIARADRVEKEKIA